MVGQRTLSTSVIANSKAVVQEAIRVMAMSRTARRWVCEACGMIHTGTAPAVCDSCGLATALVQQAELHREMNSHW